MTTTPIEPCDPRELAVLRGLLSHKTCCEWFEAMGISYEIFEDRRCRVLASWALANDCKGRPLLVSEALHQAGNNDRSMLEWIEFTFGQAAPPDPAHREDLVRQVENLEAAVGIAKESDRPRAQRLADFARRGLAKYDEVQQHVAQAAWESERIADIERYAAAMRDACRELSPRWFPRALREAADYYERTGLNGTDPAEGIAYLDHLLTFIRGEID